MNIRKYVYGISSDGNKEYMHSFLDEKGAMSYIEKHRKLFPDRFVSYSIYSGDREIMSGL